MGLGFCLVFGIFLLLVLGILFSCFWVLCLLVLVVLLGMLVSNVVFVYGSRMFYIVLRGRLGIGRVSCILSCFS